MNKNVLRLFFKPLTILNKFTAKDSRLIFFYSNLGFRDNVKAMYDREYGVRVRKNRL